MRTPPSRIEVRPARADEFAAIADLTAAIYVAEGYVSANYVDHIRDVAERAQSAVVLAAVDLDDGRVLGSVTFAPPGSAPAQIAGPDEGEFRLLVVDPAGRGRGVGETLVRACIDRARERGCARLVLSTQPTMTAAHRLYERLGFRRETSRDWRLEHGVAMRVYLLDL